MNIFVANLNFKIQSEHLQEIFEEYGEVTSAKVIMDRETGRSKGFGFVEMANDEEAKKAIETLNGAELEGKTIAVKEAEPRGSYQPKRSFGGGGGGNRGGGGYNKSFKPRGDYNSNRDNRY
jgi:RNA recognition motif-containing protein